MKASTKHHESIMKASSENFFTSLKRSLFFGDDTYLRTFFPITRNPLSSRLSQHSCYRGNVTKITQMVPEYSPQRGNPWKGFRPRGFLYSFLMVFCNTHSHSSRKNVTPTHTEFVHKVTFFTREVTFLRCTSPPRTERLTSMLTQYIIYR